MSHREHVHGEYELRAEHGPELVRNTGDRPEPVLTAKQWQDIQRLADNDK